LRARGRLATPGVEVAWTGDAGFGDSAFARLDASGQVRDLARFAGGTAGRFPFQVQAEASGALPRPAHARATFTLGSGTLAGRQLARGSAQARLEGTRLQVHELQVEADGMRVGGDARADLDRRSLDASLELLLAGRGRAAGTVSLARTRAGWEGHVRGLTLAPEALPAWTSDGAATLAFRDGMRLDGLRLRSGAQRADLSLAVRADGALTGTLAVSALQLAPLCTVAGTTCGGVATGRLQAAGSTTAPRLSLGASAHDVAVGPLARSSIDAAIHWEAGRAAGRVTVAGLGGSVVVSGSVPAPIGRPPVARDALDLRITARDLAITRLAAWRPQIVRAATGTIRGDLHLGGTWDAPRPDGTLRLRAAALELVASGARWEDVVVALRADGARGLVIERLTAAGGSGTLQGSGRFDFVRGAVPTVDVRLELERFLAVDRPVLEASVDGRLRVTGPLTGPTVRGRLYVPDGTVRPAFLPAANAPLEPDPTIEVVGLPGTEAAPPPPSMGELALGVTITLGDGMRIRRRDANVQLGGTLHVERTPPGPLTVRGTVEIERGWYTFSGRRFTMRSGEVRFTGGPVDTAVLDLEATHRTTEYDVTVAVQGTIGTPELLLSSDPPLDETDVLAVLLVGRPSGELSDSERLSVQAEAASLAVGYVVPGLGGGLGDALPLDEVQVGLEQVRVGQHVGSDVFISLSQQFSGWAGQTMAVEYTITRRLSVELSTSSRGSGAIDFFWRRRY
ncbi:MAG TPA: translocation/assembly module TamB domain-containing protein, partial [Candidatus Limnocylindria bacterium]|nr:translocation/assembly module TamB domain-containing protein [Candidatus Limnocylindria bacterium]